MFKFTKLGVSAAALLATAGAAQAGGLDRSGLSTAPLFQDGTYAEISFGYVAPSVSGLFMGSSSSGDMASNYGSIGMAFKTDINDKLSVALIFEEAYGAAVDYTNNAGYPIYGFTAVLSGQALSALARYKLNDNISVHGGVRLISMSGTIDYDTVSPGTYFDYAGSSDIGYTIGASYEIPDIALRATLTYNSATHHNNDITVSGVAPAGTTGEYELPQSVVFDFQTGIAQNTLIMGSVKWTEWTATSINTAAGALGVIDYDNDVFTYMLGVGHRFSESFSGVAQVSYEKANGGLASNLSPTDGKLGLTLAGIYTMDNVKITAGINYTKLGDATTETIGADFSGNYALGIGLKVGVTF